MTATLIILTSPLQAAHAEQYLAHARIDPDHCWVAFVKSRLESDNDRTRAILRRIGFERVREFEPLVRAGIPPFTKDGKEHALAIREFADYDSRRSFRERVNQYFAGLDVAFDRVVLGDYRPVSYRQFLAHVDLNKAECVLLDDGSVSQAVMGFRENKKNAKEVFRASPFKGTALRATDPLSYPDPSQLTYFTIYRGRLADGDTIVPNDHYDRFLEGGEPALLDELWIAGCSHVENDITSEERYLELCIAARKLAPELRCVYLPHRREDPVKVRKMGFIVGAQIRQTDGIESAIARDRIAPRILVSFGSTVLDTVSRMVGTLTSCVLVAPPPAYFLGPRREHIEEVVRANVRDNTHVVGLFGDDRAAAGRWKAAAIVQPSGEPKGSAAPSETSALSGAAAQNLENLEAQPEPDGGVLLLESGGHGLHRFQIADVGLASGERALRAFRIAGEGRSDIRLRIVSELDRNVYAECDLNLDLSNSAEALKDGVRALASVRVDEQRRAVVTVVFSAERAGRYLIQIIHRPSATAKSSFMLGNTDIGVSLPPQVEQVGETVRLDGDAVLQVAAGDALVGVLRVTAGGKPFDVALTAAPKPETAAPFSRSASWALLNHAAGGPEEILYRTTPVLVRREPERLVLSTWVDAIEIPLGVADAEVAVSAVDPYSGERRIVEVAHGPQVENAAACYAVAY
ncbi:hypothetical protein [Methylopila turkensis]|uniref:Uncharacterized protein n=1 Tax=Methylopila turkensis TaxID=1437816 RepID=A0A9W6JMH8_9HYPH|nr:hypothetical protein [Methylopila turkensis]GLK78409.1 hypothetical protein GCM10008174_01500 [Methylopila turkensis]